MDVVYVTRSGSNPELRYSLRSLEAHLAALGTVWVVGHVEPWLTGVRPIATPQGHSKYDQVRRNWLAALDVADLPDRFVYMNDDFFVTEPVDELPVWHRGSLEEHAARLPAVSDRAKSLRATADMLRLRGHTTLSYETHTPLAVDKQILGFALWLGENRLPRSLYANIARIGGEQLGDAKVRSDAQALPPAPYLSTNDQSFATGEVGRIIREQFPRPSRFERAAR